MMKDIVEVRDLAAFIRFDGVFEPLRERADFVAVAVHPELGTVCWPGGAGLDPDLLYARLTGEALPFPEPRASAS